MTATSIEAEVASLSRRYGKPKTVAHALQRTSFGPLNGAREAEVAMAIRRPSGGILLQTKDSYPDQVFRLPTGGLKRGEMIEHALLRETEEETALEVDVARFLAVLQYRTLSGRSIFRSYLFLLEERGGVLQENDPEEGITGWIEADRAGLDEAARRLRACPGTWRHWGNFRAIVIETLVGAMPR